jgi:hypothetical protein
LHVRLPQENAASAKAKDGHLRARGASCNLRTEMSIVGFIKRNRARLTGDWVKWRLCRRPPEFSLDRANWERSLQEPTLFYLECLRYFHQQLPGELKDHRAYFHNVPRNRRGFGEDAFHVLWFLLFREFRPSNFLEIGVFRGQIISLAALLARMGGWKCDVFGISPFTAAGDSVSRYREDIDYHSDTLTNFSYFGLPQPQLVRAVSTDPQARDLVASRSWEMIYIDGNHDYEVVRKDWEASSESLAPSGVIVLDDSASMTAYRPPVFATAGHPGPSRLAQEIDHGRFCEIIRVGHNRVFQKI